MRGSDRCHRHLKGPRRTAVDRARKPRLMYAAFSGAGGEKARQRALQALARIERRELHMAWAIDPPIPGATTVLSRADERRVLRWLQNRFGLDLDAVQPHGRPFTPWARDLIVLGIRGVFAEAKVARRIGVAKARDATVQFAERRRSAHNERCVRPASPRAGKTKLQPVLAERTRSFDPTGLFSMKRFQFAFSAGMTRANWSRRTVTRATSYWPLGAQTPYHRRHQPSRKPA